MSRCKKLVLDAGPLLSLSPLRGLAETFVTVPQVLAELKDRKAREHLEKLASNYGIKIEVMSPDPVSLATVINRAKQTGDYSVLSHPDLCVLALTYALHEKAKAETEQQEIETATEKLSMTDADRPTEAEAESEEAQDEDELPLEPLDVELQPIKIDDEPIPNTSEVIPSGSSAPLYDDPSDSDDGEGEWITPANVGYHKSKALEFLPDAKGKAKAKDEHFAVGCMTADFAMQNVLLQLGLALVSTEGKRIDKVKTWVLRCHACFKICKDASKKFCPSCGNPSLLRTSVTVAAPDASPNSKPLQVHLKPNFQYRVRGTKYSIPAPKPGSAKTGPGEGLILREDQVEYMRAKKMAEGKREREEAKMMKGILAKGANGEVSSLGSWMDPDWVPEMLTGGKGRTMRSSKMDGDMPIIGYGKKNPNERRRHKK